jgi:hypothetical protein
MFMPEEFPDTLPADKTNDAPPITMDSAEEIAVDFCFLPGADHLLLTPDFDLQVEIATQKLASQFAAIYEPALP